MVCTAYGKQENFDVWFGVSEELGSSLVQLSKPELLLFNFSNKSGYNDFLEKYTDHIHVY